MKRKKNNVERPYNMGTMTSAEYFGKIRSGLRRAFIYWKPLQAAAEKASRPNQSENKRLLKEYQCDICKDWFKRADTHIDHIIPCGSLRNYEDVVPFLINLTTENPDNYQLLCKKCHLIKTKKERNEKKNIAIG